MAFKKGDKVKRARGHDFSGVQLGAIYIVESDDGRNNLRVEGSICVFNSDFFELVQSPNTLTHFEKDKWYRFIKTKDTCDTHFNRYGEMDAILDGLPHQCTNSSGDEYASFQCTGQDNWKWSLTDFEECDAPVLTEFIEGHWYVHPSKEHNSNWCSDMDSVLDGEPHRCMRCSGCHARFDCTGSSWHWKIDEFQECPAPAEERQPEPKFIFRKGDRVKRVSGGSFNKVCEGQIYTVKEDATENSPLRLEGQEGSYTIGNFKLVEPAKRTESLRDLFCSDDVIKQTMGVKPMEPVKTKFEEEALKEAKEQQIKIEIERKAQDYQAKVISWRDNEQLARTYREKADELAKFLKLTKEEKENLL